MTPTETKLSFEALYGEYGERVLNLAYRFTGNTEVARDLTQDIFLKVYRNLNRFRQKSQPYTWIYRIAMNHLINHAKREKKWKWYQLLDKKVSDLIQAEELPVQDGVSGHLERPDKVLEKAEREKLVLRMINSLPVKYRAPLILQRYEGMQNQQIADTLSISLSAVETRIHRAKKTLMEKLKPWIKHI